MSYLLLHNFYPIYYYFVIFEYIDYLTPTDEEILQIKKDSIDNLPKNPPEIIVKS